MQQARVTLDRDQVAGPVDRRIFGSFVEHLGRAVYGGVYDPGSPLADADGLRRDVIEATRDLGVSMIRYPGGNFVSAYNWRDGVGPCDSRPRRLDPAWRSLEPNTFGTDEFLGWCGKAQVEPMMAVNLGLGSPEEAAAWVEYCNSTVETANTAGRPKVPKASRPVRLWGLGNEMDGPWQAGHCTAEQYADRARTAAKLMRMIDPTIQTVAAGSSSDAMPTYLEWDRVILDRLWDDVDYIGVHRYSENHRDHPAWFLADGVEVERVLQDYAALLRVVRASRKSKKRVFVCFDEWNIWYRARGGVHEDGGWRSAPPLLQEGYNLEDALVVAQYLMAFLRHADTVRAACLAQLVNVIAPIVTTREGLLRQTIYHPFALIARHSREVALRPSISAPTYDADERQGVPLLDAAATAGETGWSCFLVNRSVDEPLDVRLELRNLAGSTIAAVHRVAGDHPKLANTFAEPEAVVPAEVEAPPMSDGVARLTLPPLSFTAVVGG